MRWGAAVARIVGGRNPAPLSLCQRALELICLGPRLAYCNAGWRKRLCDNLKGGEQAMSVRVVARVRPLLKSEHADDSIVEVCEAHGPNPDQRPSIVKIPNPKNTSENFSFQFNSVYGQHASQQEIFDAEGELKAFKGALN
jgi:hypothetical protein